MLANAVMTYAESLPLPQGKPSGWEYGRRLGDVPWCKSFDQVLPREPNAQAPVKIFVLSSELPKEAEEDCLRPGNRMRFTQTVLDETSLEDNPLVVLAVEEDHRMYSVGRASFTPEEVRKADLYSGTILTIEKNGRVILPSTRVLIQDTVEGDLYSVSPKVLRKDR